MIWNKTENIFICISRMSHENGLEGLCRFRNTYLFGKVWVLSLVVVFILSQQGIKRNIRLATWWLKIVILCKTSYCCSLLNVGWCKVSFPPHTKPINLRVDDGPFSVFMLGCVGGQDFILHVRFLNPTHFFGCSYFLSLSGMIFLSIGIVRMALQMFLFVTRYFWLIPWV